MRLYEFVDSDQQLMDIIKPILIRAKAEGATEVDVNQLLNDINDSSVSPELLVNILNKKRDSLKNIITRSTLDTISLNAGPSGSMTTKYDQEVAKMKTVAVNKAKDDLK